MRLCCDFRSLNSKTVPDRHPNWKSPWQILRKKWFSVPLQKKPDYWICLDADSHPLISSAEFQHFIENCLVGIRDEFAFLYLYDEIVLSSRLEAHLEHLQIVFRWLREKGLKSVQVSASFSGEIIFRGFQGLMISEAVYKNDEKNISAVISLSQTPRKIFMSYAPC